MSVSPNKGMSDNKYIREYQMIKTSMSPRCLNNYTYDMI